MTTITTLAARITALAIQGFMSENRASASTAAAFGSYSLPA
jgi:hypothetical protein